MKSAAQRPKVAVHTLGCKVNQSESREIMEKIAPWADIVPFGSEADVTIINSCLVTTHAERETRQMVHRAARFSPGRPIILTGCYVALHGSEATSLEDSVTVVGMDEKWRIPDIVRELVGEAPNESGPPELRAPIPGRPPLWVQTGCDKRCAYCIIPDARGASRSRNLDETLLIFDSYIKIRSEVVLTGINLASWGLDLEPPQRFHDLVRMLIRRMPPRRRIRLGSMEPELVDDGLLDVLADDRVAPHVHLPLQGGTDRLLQDMGRVNTLKQYENVVRNILDVRPEAAVGADIIIGYPTETEEDFKNALQFIKDMPLAYLHVFSYSPRPGTRAAELNLLPSDTVKHRTRLMRELGAEKRRSFILSKEGTTELMSPERRKGHETTGMAGAYFQVSVPDPLPLDCLVRVRLGHFENGAMKATVIAP